MARRVSDQDAVRIVMMDDDSDYEESSADSGDSEEESEDEARPNRGGRNLRSAAAAVSSVPQGRQAELRRGGITTGLLPAAMDVFQRDMPRESEILGEEGQGNSPGDHLRPELHDEILSAEEHDDLDAVHENIAAADDGPPLQADEPPAQNADDGIPALPDHADDIVYSHTATHECDNSDEAKDDNEWTRRDDKPDLPPFTGNPGQTEPLPPNPSVMDFVNLFFTASFWSLLVRETNRYAQQYLRKNEGTLPPHARARSWIPVTIREMKIFIALWLLSGLVHKPQLHLYWSSDPLISTPAFHAIMSSKRYKLILEFLHFADNEAAVPENSRLRKVKPLLDNLVPRFQAVYNPAQCISIDEELVLYKGRLAFRQFIPSKRSRFGVKIYALCDVHGYFWNAYVYEGKQAQALPLTNVVGASGAIVCHLLSSLKNKGYHLYLDNFYTSIALAQYLRGTWTTCVCGTMRPNRARIPQVLKDANLLKGEYAFRRLGPVLCLKLHDRKVIYFLSTLHNTKFVSTRKRNRDNQVIHRLEVNHHYNRYMGGVDKNDAMINAYSALRKSYKWYIKIAFHFLEEAVQNAFILYKQHPNAGKLEHFQFILATCEGLLHEAESVNVANVGTLHRLIGKHYAEYIPATEKKARPTKRCRVCTVHGRRAETRFQCESCINHPPLCIVPCFKIYHECREY